MLRGCRSGVALQARNCRYFSSVASPDGPSAQNSEKYCLELLRKSDRPAYTQTPFLPRRIRPLHVAVRALNVELASIPDTVSNVTIGRMRMQFWRDSLPKIFDGRPPSEPIATLLADAVAHVPVTRAFLSRLIKARETRLGHPPFANVQDMEDYAESTYAVLLYVMLEALGRPTGLDHIASSIGRAQGIANLLRGIPYYASRRVVMLPLEECAKHSLSHEMLLRDPQAVLPHLQDVVFEVATRANDYLITADTYIAEAGEECRNREVKSILLAAVPTRLFLRRLERAQFNIFDPELQKAEWSLPFHYWWHS